MFGKRLEQLRKSAGLSQAEFGKRLGEKYGEEYRLSQTVVSAYEKEVREPSNAIIYVKIADFFGVSTDYLFGVSDEKSTSLLDEVQQQLSTLKPEALTEAAKFVEYLHWRENH